MAIEVVENQENKEKEKKVATEVAEVAIEEEENQENQEKKVNSEVAEAEEKEEAEVEVDPYKKVKMLMKVPHMLLEKKELTSLEKKSTLKERDQRNGTHMIEDQAQAEVLNFKKVAMVKITGAILKMN